jgi:hypothetical protein
MQAMGAAATGPGSISEALGKLLSTMEYLADVDYSQLPAAVKADCLKVLERTDAVEAAARAGLIAAFDAQDDYELDGQKTVTAWLAHRTRITKEEAREHRGWARRKEEHPLIIGALRAGTLSKSWARKLMRFTDRIPAEFRQDAETIIVTAAGAGAELQDLIMIAAEILARTAGPDEDDRPFKDRQLRLEVTVDGAGVITGELSPECAAAAQAVLGKLAARRGKEDIRSQGERMHDALYDAFCRLLGTDLLPRKDGHPVQAVVHIGLADLLALDDGSVLQRQWTQRLAARWAACRAGAAENGGGDGSAWISGPAARGIACDAALFPIVTGEVDLSAVEDLLKYAAGGVGDRG